MSTREPEHPIVTERKTSELCGDQVQNDLRCMRPKHHDGEHECYRTNGAPARWK